MEKKEGHQSKTFWAWVWHYCCSIKVALTFLILLAVMSIVGTLIAQEPIEKLLEIYPPATAEIVFKTGLNDVYNSWWFVTTLALFITNLTCCSWERFFPTWRLITKPKEVVSADFINARKDHDEFLLPASVKLDELAKIIKKYGYYVKTPEENNLYASKGRWSRIGYIVTHVSIIMVMLGAIIGNMTGYKGFMEIQEGRRTSWYWNRTLNQEAQFDFALSLDKLYLEYYPPEFYLHITEVTDFQSSKLLATPKVSFEGKFKIPGTKVEAQIVDYRPDYRNEDSKDFTVKPVFPAILVKFRQDNQEIEEAWVSVTGANFPAPAFNPNMRIILYNLITDRTKDYKSVLSVYDKEQKVFTKTIEVNDPLRYKGVTFYQSSFDKERQVTGLQVARDPGVPIVYVFCTTMIFGVMLSFYMSHRQIWLKAETGPKGQRKILIAGLASKNTLGFQQEYDKILHNLKSENTVG